MTIIYDRSTLRTVPVDASKSLLNKLHIGAYTQNMKAYNTQDVANFANIHITTLIRWLKKGVIPEPKRDAHGWRKFDEFETAQVVQYAQSHQLLEPDVNSPALKVLKELDWNFASSKTNYLTHGLHPYPAKFIPQIPNALIQELSSVGDTVADIFCGSGTTLLEALQLKRNAIGIDANPLSALLSRAKTQILSESEISEASEFQNKCSLFAAELLGDKDAMFKSLGSRPDPKVSEFWFEPHVVEELAELRLRMNDLSSKVQLLSMIALSAIVVAVSLQDSDTRYVRRKKNIGTGDTTRRFSSTLKSAISAAAEVADVLESRFDCNVVHSDILDAPIVGDIDLMVTSPPYPNAFSYHLYHRTRLHWLGYNEKTFKAQEIGSHRKYSSNSKNALTEKDFEVEFDKIFEWLAGRMKSGKYACFVIGNSTIKGRSVDNAEILSNSGKKYGFAEDARIERNILSTKKSFNPSHGRIKSEHILVLRRLSV